MTDNIQSSTLDDLDRDVAASQQSQRQAVREQVRQGGIGSALDEAFDQAVAGAPGASGESESAADSETVEGGGPDRSKPQFDATFGGRERPDVTNDGKSNIAPPGQRDTGLNGGDVSGETFDATAEDLPGQQVTDQLSKSQRDRLNLSESDIDKLQQGKAVGIPSQTGAGFSLSDQNLPGIDGNVNIDTSKPDARNFKVENLAGETVDANKLAAGEPTRTDFGDDIVGSGIERAVGDAGSELRDVGSAIGGTVGDVAGGVAEVPFDLAGQDQAGDVVDSATEKVGKGAGSLLSTPADLAGTGIEVVETGGALTREAASGDVGGTLDLAGDIAAQGPVLAKQSARAAQRNPFKTGGSLIVGFGASAALSKAARTASIPKSLPDTPSATRLKTFKSDTRAQQQFAVSKPESDIDSGSQGTVDMADVDTPLSPDKDPRGKAGGAVPGRSGPTQGFGDGGGPGFGGGSAATPEGFGNGNVITDAESRLDTDAAQNPRVTIDSDGRTGIIGASVTAESTGTDTDATTATLADEQIVENLRNRQNTAESTGTDTDATTTTLADEQIVENLRNRQNTAEEPSVNQETNDGTDNDQTDSTRTNTRTRNRTDIEARNRTETSTRTNTQTRVDTEQDNRTKTTTKARAKATAATNTPSSRESESRRTPRPDLPGVDLGADDDDEFRRTRKIEEETFSSGIESVEEILQELRQDNASQ